MIRNNLFKSFLERKIEFSRGIRIDFSNKENTKCSYYLCCDTNFIYNDEVICYTSCRHFYHKSCIEVLSELKSQENANQLNTLMLEDIVDESFLERTDDQGPEKEDGLKETQLYRTKYLCYYCLKYN